MQIRGSMQTAAEFEKLQLLIKHEAVGSMPQSVRMRYEDRLAVLRRTLRTETHSYPLGAILVSIGAVTDEQLNRALRIQSQSNNPKLLGEFLVEMNIIGHDKLTHALTIQRSTASSSYSQIT
ncbi:hypothetical protein KKG90_09145 [Candidatus Bipolaricaulota bacterium]|nr:hypothetical protein [Candidatus Bipolaricaulota bacterium]